MLQTVKMSLSTYIKTFFSFTLRAPLRSGFSPLNFGLIFIWLAVMMLLLLLLLLLLPLLLLAASCLHCYRYLLCFCCPLLVLSIAISSPSLSLSRSPSLFDKYYHLTEKSNVCKMSNDIFNNTITDQQKEICFENWTVFRLAVVTLVVIVSEMSTCYAQNIVRFDKTDWHIEKKTWHTAAHLLTHTREKWENVIHTKW